MLKYYEGLHDVSCVPESVREYVSDELKLAMERRDFLRQCMKIKGATELESLQKI